MKYITAQQALGSRNEIQAFSHKYGAYVSDSREYRRRVPEPISFDPYGEYKSYYQSPVRDEAFVEIHLPREAFEHLLGVISSQEHDADRINHAMTVLKQARIDERVRDDNPAVQTAWQKYLMLLEIARK